MREAWWVSCDVCTILVVVDERLVITDIAPIGRRFLGQPWRNLLAWVRPYNPSYFKLPHVEMPPEQLTGTDSEIEEGAHCPRGRV